VPAADADQESSDDDRGEQGRPPGTPMATLVSPIPRGTGEVCHRRIEVTDGAGGEGGLEALLELIGRQPTLSRRSPQVLGHPFTFRIGHTEPRVHRRVPALLGCVARG
jgi:hypothetical protein